MFKTGHRAVKFTFMFGRRRWRRTSRQLHGASRVDRFHAGDRTALTPSERASMWLFESRGRCWVCHSGPNFTDEGFHNTGIGSVAGTPQAGRFAITNAASDLGAFKTPTLRGLTDTAPYMHDGSLATLEEVVEFYRAGARPNSHLDHPLHPIELTDTEAASLVDFLRALADRGDVALE